MKPYVEMPGNMLTDYGKDLLKGGRLVAEIKYAKCKFVAKLDDQTYHDIKVVVPKCTPYEYVWMLAIRECNKFKSPLQQLSFVEEVTTNY